MIVYITSWKSSIATIVKRHLQPGRTCFRTFVDEELSSNASYLRMRFYLPLTTIDLKQQSSKCISWRKRQIKTVLWNFNVDVLFFTTKFDANHYDIWDFGVSVCVHQLVLSIYQLTYWCLMMPDTIIHMILFAIFWMGTVTMIVESIWNQFGRIHVPLFLIII